MFKVIRFKVRCSSFSVYVFRVYMFRVGVKLTTVYCHCPMFHRSISELQHFQIVPFSNYQIVPLFSLIGSIRRFRSREKVFDFLFR